VYLLAFQTTTTTIAPSGASADPATSLGRLLLFGVFALAVFSLIYWFSFNNSLGRRTLNVTFSRLYGLIAVAVLAVALAFAGVNEQSLTAAFTLLGTIAGYLAGAKATESPTTTVQPAQGDGGGAPTFEAESIL